MTLVQKFNTSSLDIVVREPMGVEGKWSSVAWDSDRKCMSATEFLSTLQWCGDHFNQKERSAMPLSVNMMMVYT